MPSKKRTLPPSGPRLVGYARVSTAEQNLDMQISALSHAGVLADNIWAEKVSAGSSKRPQLALALLDTRAGDTFVVWKLDRMSRSMLDLLARMKDLEDRGVNFRSLTEGIDTNTPAGKLLLHVIGALAQFERDLIVERTKAGIAEFKAKGGRIGQPRKLSDDDMAEVMQMVRDGDSVRKIAARFNVVPGTIYNYLEGTISALRAEGQKPAKRKRKPSK